MDEYRIEREYRRVKVLFGRRRHGEPQQGFIVNPPWSESISETESRAIKYFENGERPRRERMFDPFPELP